MDEFEFNPRAMCDQDILEKLKQFVAELPPSENAFLIDLFVTYLDRLDDRLRDIENNYERKEGYW